MGHTLDESAIEVGRPPVSLVWATWALFVGLALLLAGAGVYATLIGVRSELDGFNAIEIGLVGAAYYGGFLVGSRVTLASLGRVGHIRVYSALAALLAASIIVAGFQTAPPVWIALRFVAGACLAGQYVVAESWLNHLVENEARAKLLSLYLVVTVVAYGVGQFAFGAMDPETLVGFAAAAVLVSLAVVPVTLSEDASPPVVAKPPPMSLRELWRLVPTGVVTSFLVGLTHGAFIGLGAVYATRAGMSVPDVALFVAMPTVGNVVFSVPVATISDRFDRRIVGALAAMGAAIVSLALAQVGPEGLTGLVCMALIGGLTYPLYSIAGAYTNDLAPRDRLTSVASQLVVLYGAGAFVGPLLGSLAMARFGIEGFAWTSVGAHAVIAVFLVARAAQHRPADRLLADLTMPVT